MKNKYTSKFIALGIIAITFFLISLLSCNQSNKNSAAEPDNISNDSLFLVETATSNLIEIKMTQLAQTKTSYSDSVKDFAKMLEHDHRNIYIDLQTLAKAKAITIPTSISTEDLQKMHNELDEKDEKDFDKEFCEMMINKHEKSIAKFEKKAKDAYDLDVRNFAAFSLPTLKKHLDIALRCKKRCEERETTP